MATITLDDLLALNKEIAGLVRAGVPLEKHLGELGNDLPGKLGELATLVAQRTAHGESMAEVITEQAAHFPPVYRAVIEAGCRAGRLPAALESLAGMVRRIAQTRRALLFSAFYPFFLLILLCLFFAFFSYRIAPHFLSAFESFQVPGRLFFSIFSWLGQYAAYWAVIIPLILVFGMAGLWHKTRQAGWLDHRGIGRLFVRIPWIGAMIEASRNAVFTEILATLLEQQVPLHEALILAADATGGSSMQNAVRPIAENIEFGRSIENCDGLGLLTPLLRWIISSSSGKNLLLPALQRAGTIYHRRADYLAECAQVYFPMLMIGVLAGGITLIYALCLIAPYAYMLFHLTNPFK